MGTDFLYTMSVRKRFKEFFSPFVFCKGVLSGSYISLYFLGLKIQIDNL